MKNLNSSSQSQFHPAQSYSHNVLKTTPSPILYHNIQSLPISIKKSTDLANFPHHRSAILRENDRAPAALRADAGNRPVPIIPRRSATSGRPAPIFARRVPLMGPLRLYCPFFNKDIQCPPAALPL